MSSAALQSSPHQPTSVGSHSPIPATSASSSRQYQSGTPQSREAAAAAAAYYNQQPSTNASPSSTRRPSRRPSGNGASSNPSNNQQQQYYSPAPTSNSMTNNRGPTSNPASPVVASAAPTGHPSMAPGDHRSGVPPVVSPRTSSTNRTAHAAAAAATDRSGASRRTYANESSNSPRQTDGQQDLTGRDRSQGNGVPNGVNDDIAVAAANAASRQRRRTQQSPEGIPHRPSQSREARAQAAARQQPTPPSGLSREASEVLNRVVISKPEVDIDRERERMAEAIPSSPTAQATSGGQSEGAEEPPRGSRSRHDHASSKREKNSKFGDYYLGNTLGEGEFGKVKMGWKQEGGVQVAVKLIRRDSVGTNPTRLAKIYREIAILREISHPNIVRLHEMVETEKQIGIILEYASGGELFDYILNHRYLKDNAARRLFAQLVSGVGYLHKKGIVHRDLKLENLLLDRNRNIIITDFGFANTFNAEDELGDEVEYNLSSKDYVKRMELDKILPNGYRRGDLMQTSCGSPCYAAPELVVSDSLYTGRKVDVWSCGVILYAMLAGYLPFDDDPANPEGDNINLLYKYIVSTPLTFPEYVTPHARDLLRRILVPDPRKRADLFEVARHSWLSEYSHVVGFITSSTTTTGDIANTHVGSEEQEAPLLARSASVREPSSKAQKQSAAVGELGRKHGNVDQEAELHPKPAKDNKRRTVQVEYVAPKSQTQRGEAMTATAPSGSRTRARAGSQGPVEVSSSAQAARRQASVEKPLPRDPPTQEGQYGQRRPSSSQRQQAMAPPTRPGREPPRAVSDAHYGTQNAPPVSIARPTTGGSMTSSRSGSLALASRGSYSTPAAPAVAGHNAQGRMSQPPQKSTRGYNISEPLLQDDQLDYGRPSSNQVPPKFAQVSGFPDGSAPPPEQKTHKRSSTITGIFSRTNSIFGGKAGKLANADQEKPKKSYPPVSMSKPVGQGQETPRPSMDSRRSISFGFGKKRSGSINGSQTTLPDNKSRRFSLLPASFSLKSIGIGKDNLDSYDNRPDSRGDYLDPPQTARTDRSQKVNAGYTADGSYDASRDSPVQDRRGTSTGSPSQHQRYGSRSQPSAVPRSSSQPQYTTNFRQDQSALANESESSLNIQQQRGQHHPDFNEYDDRQVGQGYVQPQPRPQPQSQYPQAHNRASGRGVLQKPNRKFTEAYEGEQTGNAYGARQPNHSGSSGAARKVMDFFSRRRRTEN